MLALIKCLSLITIHQTVLAVYLVDLCICFLHKSPFTNLRQFVFFHRIGSLGMCMEQHHHSLYMASISVYYLFETVMSDSIMDIIITPSHNFLQTRNVTSTKWAPRTWECPTTTCLCCTMASKFFSHLSSSREQAIQKSQVLRTCHSLFSCRFAFTNDAGKPTLEPVGDPHAAIGQRVGLSSLDVVKMNKLYGCS